MTIKHFILSLAIAAAVSACSNGKTGGNNSIDKNVVPETATEFKAGGAVEYANNVSDILPDKSLPTIIDFNATWCGPCQRFAPIFEETAKAFQGKALFISVDVDNSPLVAERFGVSSIPQISILLPDGTVKSTVGFMGKDQFTEFISPYIK